MKVSTWMLVAGILLVAVAVVGGFVAPPIEPGWVIAGVILIAADQVVDAIKSLQTAPRSSVRK